MDDWRKAATTLDKDHAKERKKLQIEIRQLCSEVRSAQSRVRKGKRDAQAQLDGLLEEVNQRKSCLEELERRAVVAALVEERMRFCMLVGCLKPLADTESSMATEMTSIQDVVDSMCLLASDPCHLPASSEQVIDDYRRTQCKWFCQTPPGSRSGSPRGSSHRSSICSISSSHSSLASSSPAPQSSPIHCSQPVTGQHCRLPADMLHVAAGSSTVSSLDSGFISHDASSLYTGYHDPALLQLTNPKKYHHNNGNAETPASTWTSWSADISTDQSQSSPCHKLPSHRSQSPQRSGLLVPGAHPGCYDAEMTSHELHDVSPVSNVPSATYECRLSSPTTPVSAAITSANQQQQLREDEATINDASPLSRVIDVLNKNTATLDNLFTDKAAPVESYDDFDSVMKKLELSAASLAEVAANKDKNLAPAAAAGFTSPSVVAAAVRHTSLQCPIATSSSAARTKPPPPVRRTSSVSGTRPLIQSPTSDAGIDDRRFPGDLPSPCRPRSIVDGRPTSPRYTPPLVRVSQAPRRSLSTAYADLCQTLNDQLAAGGGGVARRPGGQRLSVVNSSTTAAPAQTARRQSSAEVGSARHADTLLLDIKRGVTLRPTVTNDRSAPSIHRT